MATLWNWGDWPGFKSSSTTTAAPSTPPSTPSTARKKRLAAFSPTVSTFGNGEDRAAKTALSLGSFNPSLTAALVNPEATKTAGASPWGTPSDIFNALFK